MTSPSSSDPAGSPARILRGRLSYGTADGRETGREWFELIDQSGGHVLRAYCEMDDAALTRDVTLRMDRDWRPQDGFCRIVHGDGRSAAMWFDVGQDEVRLDSTIDGVRSAPQTLPLDAPLAYLGLHPLQGDALIVKQRGCDRVGEFIAIACMTNSISPNGDEAIGLHRVTIEVAFLGHTEMTVPAGTFAAAHYALRWAPEWPPADLWVRARDDLFLRMAWSHVAAAYELVELQEA